MAVTPEQPAPYAPSSAVLEIVNRFRDRGLPTPITGEVLARAGISDSLLPRTLQALQALDLIDGDGRPTQILDGIRRAPQAEYEQRLREWLTAAYADALQFIDPATADEVAVRDAFRNYNPVGQQGRMVSLFTNLWRAAGVGPDKDRSAPRKAPAVSGKPRVTPAKPIRQPPARDDGKGAQQQSNSGGLPPALAGLLASLPSADVGWTQQSRDRFVQTFGAVLDFCFPIITEEERSRRADIEREMLEDTV